MDIVDFQAIKRTYIQHEKLCVLFRELLGDISVYELFTVCDYGETYIISSKYPIRIDYIYNKEHILLFSLSSGVKKRYGDLDKSELFNNLRGDEIKIKLKEIINYVNEHENRKTRI